MTWDDRRRISQSNKQTSGQYLAARSGFLRTAHTTFLFTRLHGKPVIGPYSQQANQYAHIGILGLRSPRRGAHSRIFDRHCKIRRNVVKTYKRVSATQRRKSSDMIYRASRTLIIATGRHALVSSCRSADLLMYYRVQQRGETLIVSERPRSFSLGVPLRSSLQHFISASLV